MNRDQRTHWQSLANSVDTACARRWMARTASRVEGKEGQRRPDSPGTDFDCNVFMHSASYRVRSSDNHWLTDPFLEIEEKAKFNMCKFRYRENKRRYI